MFFCISEFSLKNSMEAYLSILIDNSIFIYSLVSFYKENKITEYLFKYELSRVPVPVRTKILWLIAGISWKS